MNEQKKIGTLQFSMSINTRFKIEANKVIAHILLHLTFYVNRSSVKQDCL